jgi:hypothetical protein
MVNATRERERERVVNDGNSESSDRDHSSVKETQAKAIDPERKRTRASLPSRPARLAIIGQHR